MSDMTAPYDASFEQFDTAVFFNDFPSVEPAHANAFNAFMNEELLPMKADPECGASVLSKLENSSPHAVTAPTSPKRQATKAGGKVKAPKRKPTSNPESCDDDTSDGEFKVRGGVNPKKKNSLNKRIRRPKPEGVAGDMERAVEEFVFKQIGSKHRICSMHMASPAARIWMSREDASLLLSQALVQEEKGRDMFEESRPETMNAVHVLVDSAAKKVPNKMGELLKYDDFLGKIYDIARRAVSNRERC